MRSPKNQRTVIGSTAMINVRGKDFFIKTAVLLIYGTITLIGALNHEMWLDEAQAWVIARDTELSDLFAVLKAEGHPPLWYIILMPFAKLGFPVEYGSLISWFFMALSAAVLLYVVRADLFLKISILCSSGFLYLNSIMLRSYCLIPILLFLIAAVYPKRKERPVVLGILLALLANTHVFIAGIVGMTGLYMLWEFFSDIKNNTLGQNARRGLGLLTAGAGVLLLVLPLIGSVSENEAVISDIPSVTSILRTAVFSLSRVAEVCLDYSELPFPVPLILSLLIQFGVVFIFILLRHWRKALALEIGFIAVYILTCEIVWIPLPNRTAIYLLSFFFTLCFTLSEKTVYNNGRVKRWLLSSQSMKKFIAFVVKCDENAQKTISIILTVIFAVTVPVGVSFLYKDLGSEFCAAGGTARLIKENLEEDAVFVTFWRGLPELSVYLPDNLIYSVPYGEFTSYMKLTAPAEKIDAEKICGELSEYSHVYILYLTDDAFPEDSFIFSYSGGIAYGSNKRYFAVCKYNEQEIYHYADIYTGQASWR